MLKSVVGLPLVHNSWSSAVPYDAFEIRYWMDEWRRMHRLTTIMISGLILKVDVEDHCSATWCIVIFKSKLIIKQDYLLIML